MQQRFGSLAPWKIVGRVIGTVLVSIIIPLATGFATDSSGKPLLSAFEQVMLGGLIFLAVTLTSVSYQLSEMAQIRQHDAEIWEIRSGVDAMLTNMRVAYAGILNQQPHDQNLFAQYFERSLSELSENMHRASVKQELTVDELTISATDILLRIVELRGYSVLRLVHTLDARPNNFDFSTWSKSYYQQLTKLAEKDKISIRRLFIYGRKTDLETPIAQHLFAFHANTKGYDYKVISRSDWTSIVRGHSLAEAQSEFGVWGETLAYIAHKSGPTHMEGRYITNPDWIERLGNVFDAGWRMGSTATLQIKGPVTLDELFKQH